MLLLLTRARDEAVRTAEKLVHNGHQAILSPVLDIKAKSALWPQGVIDALVATSARAFEALTLEDERPQPEIRRLLPLFLVGERTAAAARQRGFEGPAIVASDSKDLAERILERAVQPRHVIYLAGHDRKPDLESRLDSAGLGVETIEVYEAHATEGLSAEAIAHFHAGSLDAVLHYSRRSADIFLQLTEAAEVGTELLHHICISEDAALPLRAAGLPHIAIAAEPNETAILSLIEALASTKPSLGQGALKKATP
jgi:uroporphyrinogen-III synthase